MQHRFTGTSVLLLMLPFLGGVRGASAAITIDDFSIDQVGISAKHTAEFDTLEDPGLIGGRRVIGGGGSASQGGCGASEIAGGVSGGRMSITPGTDCGGAVLVSWSGDIGPNNLNLDLSQYGGIEIDIANLVGAVDVRFTITSGGGSGFQLETLDAVFSTPGIHVVRFSDFSNFPGQVNLNDIDSIEFGTLVQIGEFVAFDSVRIVPEPTTLMLLFVAALTFIRCRFSALLRRI